MKITIDILKTLIKEELSHVMLTESKSVELDRDSQIFLYFRKRENEPDLKNLKNLQKVPLYDPMLHPCTEGGFKRFQLSNTLFKKIYDLSNKNITQKNVKGQLKKETDNAFRVKTQQSDFGQSVYQDIDMQLDKVIQTSKEIIKEVLSFRERDKKDMVFVFFQYKCGAGRLYDLLNYLNRKNL